MFKVYFRYKVDELWWVYKLNVSACLGSVQDFSISERNKELILDFIDYCFSEGLGNADAYHWSWNFGDKSTSTSQNPMHKYTKAGKYTVKLTVKNVMLEVIPKNYGYYGYYSEIKLKFKIVNCYK